MGSIWSTPESCSEVTDIPVIDISPFLAEMGSEKKSEIALEVVRQWRQAFSSLGFAQVKGHGIPPEHIDETYSQAQKFFALSSEEKNSYDLGKGFGFGGFTPQGVEQVSASISTPDGKDLGERRSELRPPDLVESIMYYGTFAPKKNIIPSQDGYEATMITYWNHMQKLLDCLNALSALALDLPEQYFDRFYYNPAGEPTGDNSLRLAHYPAQREPPAPGSFRYGEHTDFTGFTIIWQDKNVQTGGLQVRLPNGSFVDCPPAPGAFTVNAGDLIQAWTNDVFLSNVHRVVNPPPEDALKSRISLVFFTGPSPDSVVECLPTCTDEKRPPKYAPVSAGEHLRRKVAAINT